MSTFFLEERAALSKESANSIPIDYDFLVSYKERKEVMYSTTHTR